MNVAKLQQILDQTLRWMGMNVELARATVFSSYLRHMDQLVVLGEARVNDDGTRGYREEANKVCEED